MSSVLFKIGLQKHKDKQERAWENPEDLFNEALAYFDWCDANPFLEDKVFHTDGNITHANAKRIRPYTMFGLFTFCGITQATWEMYKHGKKGDDFRDTTKIIQMCIYDQKFSGAAAGFFNATIMARDLGLADKNEITGADGGPIAQTHSMTTEDALFEQAIKLGIDPKLLGLSRETQESD